MSVNVIFNLWPGTAVCILPAPMFLALVLFLDACFTANVIGAYYGSGANALQASLLFNPSNVLFGTLRQFNIQIPRYCQDGSGLISNCSYTCRLVPSRFLPSTFPDIL